MKVKFWVPITLLVVVSLLLTSCVVPTPEVIEKIVEKPVEKIVEKIVTPAPAPLSPERQARAQNLVVAVDGRVADPTNFNMYTWASPWWQGLQQVVYEFFFYENLQTGEYIPWLAEKYAYNKDFTEITVSLRKGVAWSDGKPFGADDVVFTYNTLLKNPTMAWASEVGKWVTAVEKIDDLNVKFKLKSANPRYHQNREAFPAVGIWGAIYVLPKHIWEGQDPLKFKNNPPIGTGPYKLASASETALVYERRDDWWGIKAFGITPAPKTATFQYFGTETSVALALAANEIDFPFIGILSVGSLKEVQRRNPNVRAWHKDAPYAWLDPCPRALMVQNAKSPLDKKEARWAISYLIDRKAVVNLAYEGTTVPTWGIWPYYDGMKPYFDAVKDLRDKYPADAFDAKKAEGLLTTAGLKKGGDGAWTTADGKKLQLRYLVNADSTEEMKVSAVIADQLKAAGIDVQVQPLSGSVLSDAILRGDYDLKLHSFCPGYVFDNLELFHSKYFVELGKPAPWYERNSFRYKNTAFDKIVDEMAATPPTEVDKVKDQFKRAMAIWFDELPVMPVVQAPALVPTNSTYWTGWPSADNPWNMPVCWWATFNLVINGYQSPTTGKWVGGIKAAGAK
jgi:peptide/nickel transport system substrate-binding protein